VFPVRVDPTVTKFDSPSVLTVSDDAARVGDQDFEIGTKDGVKSRPTSGSRVCRRSWPTRRSTALS